jgi:hypothetical protein
LYGVLLNRTDIRHGVRLTNDGITWVPRKLWQKVKRFSAPTRLDWSRCLHFVRQLVLGYPEGPLSKRGKMQFWFTCGTYRLDLVADQNYVSHSGWWTLQACPLLSPKLPLCIKLRLLNYVRLS